MKRILLFALVAGISFAQTASIYELSGAEAAEGLKLHEAMLKAEADYAKWAKKMSKRYGGETNVIESDGTNIHEELEFSRDFKHAVPKVQPQSIACHVGQDCLTVGPNLNLSPLSICGTTAPCGGVAVPLGNVQTLEGFNSFAVEPTNDTPRLSPGNRGTLH